MGRGCCQERLCCTSRVWNKNQPRGKRISPSPLGEKNGEKMEKSQEELREGWPGVWDGSGIAALTRTARPSSSIPALPPSPAVSAAHRGLRLGLWAQGSVPCVPQSRAPHARAAASRGEGVLPQIPTLLPGFGHSWRGFSFPRACSWVRDAAKLSSGS